jgi:hypothetical protein
VQKDAIKDLKNSARRRPWGCFVHKIVYKEQTTDYLLTISIWCNIRFYLLIGKYHKSQQEPKLSQKDSIFGSLRKEFDFYISKRFFKVSKAMDLAIGRFLSKIRQIFLIVTNKYRLFYEVISKSIWFRNNLLEKRPNAHFSM